LVESQANYITRPLPDGIVSEEDIARTEAYWVVIMLGMLALMMAIILVTGMNAPHSPGSVETIDPTTLHLSGEFAESNLGTAAEPDGSVTARVIGEQSSFVPDCVQVPVDTSVRFRLTSADVVHGFLIPSTNINTTVVPASSPRCARFSLDPASTGCHATSSAVTVITACGPVSTSCRKINFQDWRAWRGGAVQNSGRLS
jgi:hypothetical protein